MEKDILKIFVVSHKPCDVYNDSVYTPIHVGKEISKFNHEMQNFIGDNTGVNISDKNSYYCELTALYWAWKNVDCEYIGFCHYRRYFEKKFSNENIEAAMSAVDAIIVKHTCFTDNILNYFINQLVPEDIHLFYLYMQKRFPEQKKLLDDYFVKGNTINPANMIVCRKELFDKYASWLFSILFDLEEIIKFSEYTNAKRVLGYLGEMLLGYYVKSNNLCISEMNIVPMIGQHHHLVHYSWKDKFKAWRRFSRKKREIIYNIPPQIMVGFRNEGLLTKIDNVVSKYNKA